jgi:hypothetical protein
MRKRTGFTLTNQHLIDAGALARRYRLLPLLSDSGRFPGFAGEYLRV